jgi:23S rRNA pseudouridine2605 synthase
MSERVQKIISASGYCSRRKAEDLIRAGRVTVNGRKAVIGASAENGDIIAIDGKPLQLGGRLYLLLNKPKGYVCSRDDPVIKKTVYDLVKVPGVYTVGRLDVMTEGLIILTNDGEFANRVMHPRYEVAKTYQVVVDRPFELEKKYLVERGVTLTDSSGRKFKTGKAHLSVDPKDKRNVYVTLHEGKNRVVRKMFQQLGYRIYKLVRVRIGDIKIAGLERGKWRELTAGERDGLLRGVERKTQKYSEIRTKAL